MDPSIFYQGLRRDFITFNQKCFEVLNPGSRYSHNWHIDAVGRFLVKNREAELGRAIITIPPRSLKSIMASVAWPAFLLGHNPATRIMTISYNETLAEDLSAKTRKIIEHPFYKATFPETRFDRLTRLQLTTDQGGMRFATSIGGPTTGFGAHWMIIDDPLNAADAYSQTERDRVNRHCGVALASRFEEQTKSKIVLVMQRLHEDDLAGHLLAQGGWDLLKLPARATEDMLIDVGKPAPRLFRKDELLHPDRLPESVLADLQRRMGSEQFQAQYQQDPVPVGGNRIRRDWLHWYDTVPPREGADITISLDTATKTDFDHDYSACTVWLKDDNRHFLIDVWRDKLPYPDLKRKIADLWRVHHARRLLIEDQGVGSALILELKKLGIPAIACKATGSKEARLVSATSYIEAGSALFPREAPWLADFLSELLSFPAGKHDDQVDSLSQYFNWIHERPTPIFNVWW